MENFNLENEILTTADFDQMGWHDCKVYAISFFDKENFELALDIDYILKWVKTNKNDDYFKFWVAPATLIFKNVYDININLSSIDFKIDEIVRSNPVRPKNADYLGDVFEHDWTILTSNGELTFRSIGYLQIIRQKPILVDQQFIDIKQRGGISFERISG
jgi:hypothetical protein